MTRHSDRAYRRLDVRNGDVGWGNSDAEEFSEVPKGGAIALRVARPGSGATGAPPPEFDDGGRRARRHRLEVLTFISRFFALLVAATVLLGPGRLAAQSSSLVPGDLVAIDQSTTGNPRLLRIDPTSGAFTELTPLAGIVTDIAHDPVSGDLYGVEATLSGIVRIDVDTGDLDLVGTPPPGSPEFLTIAIDPGTGTIYVTTFETLYTLAPDTGVLTPISTDTIPAFSAMAFDPLSGELYGFERLLLGVIGSFVVNLYRIDPATAQYEFIGDGGNFFGLDFDLDGHLYACDTGDTIAPPVIAPSSLSEISTTTGAVISSVPIAADNVLALAFWQGPTSARFSRGDANADLLVDVSDAVFLLAALFIPGSANLACDDAGDVNDDGGVDVSDAVFLLASLFVPGSPAPPAPTAPTCGVDTTTDALDCATATCP